MSITAPRQHERSVDQAARRFRALIEGLPTAEVQRISDDLETAVRRQPDSAKPIVRKHILHGAIEAQANEFRVRQMLLADSLTAPEVARRLGLSRQTPHDRARAGTLLAVMDRGALRFPAWQFEATGPDGVLRGLPETIRALGAMPALSKIGWMVSPKSLLPATPVEMLRSGTVQARREVLLAAEATERL